MAIKGYSNVRRLPRLGRIKLGEKVQTEKGAERPVAREHFVVPPEVAAVYGEEPVYLDIMFPVNDLDVVFDQHMKKYGQTGLLCKGDGERGMTMVNGELVEKDCDPESEECRGCQPRGTLNVLLPEVPGFGVWQVVTGSWNSIVNTNSSLDMIRTMTGGKIAFIPLRLVLKEHQATVRSNDGKQFQRTVYVLGIDIPAGMTLKDFRAKYGPGLREGDMNENLAALMDTAQKFALIGKPQPQNSEYVLEKETEEWDETVQAPPENGNSSGKRLNGREITKEHGEQARKLLHKYLTDWAKMAEINQKKVIEDAHAVMHEAYKVESCKELTPAQWVNAYVWREKLLHNLQDKYAREDLPQPTRSGEL